MMGTTRHRYKMMSGYDCRNKCVFIFRRNTISDEADVLIVCGCIVTAATEVVFYPVFVKYGKRSFAVSSPTLWNTLPPTVLPHH